MRSGARKRDSSARDSIGLPLFGLSVALAAVALTPVSLLFVARSANDDRVALRWEGTRGEIFELSELDFIFAKRALDSALQLDDPLRQRLGIAQEEPSDDDVARFLALEPLAASQGVELSSEELREHLVQILRRAFDGSRSAYRQGLIRLGGRDEVEAMLGRALVVARFLERWTEDHGTPLDLDFLRRESGLRFSARKPTSGE